MLLSEMANAQESHSSYHQSEPSIRIFTLLMKRYGLPWWLSDKNSPAVQKTQVQSLDQEDPLEEGMATHSNDSDGKESACNAGDLGSVPGWGRSSGEGHGNPLQYSCLENPIDEGARQATVHGVQRVRYN